MLYSHEPFDIDEALCDLVEEWHSAPADSILARMTLAQHLGMTADEYKLWVTHNEIPRAWTRAGVRWIVTRCDRCNGRHPHYCDLCVGSPACLDHKCIFTDE